MVVASIRTYRVAVLVGTDGEYGRGVAKGVRAFTHGRGGWEIQFRRPDRMTLRGLQGWKPDGLICETWNDDMSARFQKLKFPMVDLSMRIKNCPTVTSDNEAVGRMAAEYFRERGFQQFAYVCLDYAPYSAGRHDGFRRALESQGLACIYYRGPTSARRPHEGTNWTATDVGLREFLRTLPKPCAILTDNDGKALQLIEAVRQTGVHIPEEVAILGVDNDPLICELSQPKLSSVEQSTERIGYEAASMLDRLMAGKPLTRQTFVVPPTRVVTRQSSDVLALHDTELAAAVRFIRQNAHRPIRADEVVDQIAIARRSLERRFVAALGRTLLEEIQRAHVEAAKQLLVHTDLAMPSVAHKSGFGSSRHLSLVFREQTGQTPSRFRRANRLLS